MPKDRPKYLALNLRGFINDKQPNQVVEISINGIPQKKVTLSRFEDNLVKVTIPPSAYDQEWLEMGFKIPTANSPKTLGISPDDRDLGIGLKSAVFE